MPSSPPSSQGVPIPCPLTEVGVIGRTAGTTMVSRPTHADDPLLPDADVQAEAFRQAREARKVELFEDYVELIDDLIRDGGEARQVDIAARLGVAQPTVARMLKRLCEARFVQQRPYRGVFLTEAGRRLAAQARARPRIVPRLPCAPAASPERALGA